MANDAHFNILEQGIKVWNKWRKENPNIKPDLSGTFLFGINLAGVDFSKTYLFGANLTGADLIEANLSCAGLTGANLTKADITGAIFYGVVRSNWNIDGIVCDYIYWDPAGEKRSPSVRYFKKGEFEQSHKQLPSFTYYFKNDGASIDMVIINKIVQNIANKYPKYKLCVDSFYTTGQPHVKFIVGKTEYIEIVYEKIKKNYEKVKSHMNLYGKIERQLNQILEPLGAIK